MKTNFSKTNLFALLLSCLMVSGTIFSVVPLDNPFKAMANENKQREEAIRKTAYEQGITEGLRRAGQNNRKKKKISGHILGAWRNTPCVIS